jgi:LacI family transcriptional regulator
MKKSNSHRVSLLVNERNVYGREIIAGVANYISSTRVAWDLFLDDNLRERLDDMDNWQGDGVIGDFNDPVIREALSHRNVPVVGVGTSFEDDKKYPSKLPYVANDNLQVMRMAYDHLVSTGLPRFALFSLPHSHDTPWVEEREHAFARLMRQDHLDVEIYRGELMNSPSWSDEGERITQWLNSLPKPIGIIAINDVRARLLLQTCMVAGIPVPEQVALIGIDSDPLARVLTRIPLSSVILGAQDMGYQAAQLLHQILNGARLRSTRILVPPTGINVLASSQHESQTNPHVMRAMHYIRQYACQGIKTEQVADYVGISRSSLQSHFRKERGTSVHDEILRFKLNAATKMLEADTSNIADIAHKCGFTSVQYIHSVFKREFGCSPREYQQRMRQAKITGVAPKFERNENASVPDDE